MAAYYNENDAAAAHVLREQIARGVIAPGEVDERSIVDVCADDLRGFAQCHFFAGGGLWSVAARLAGWPDDEPLWTGSCPCQPFSVAGKGAGTDDPRHLWPHLHRIIAARRPVAIVGEQVAGAAGYGWLDGVRADLARSGYASRGVDFPACAVDAPHKRSRLYWVAVVDDEGERRGEGRPEHELRRGRNAAAGADAQSPLGDGQRAGLERLGRHGDGSRGQVADGSIAAANVRHGGDGLFADADSRGRSGRAEGAQRLAVGRTSAERPASRNGDLSDAASGGREQREPASAIVGYGGVSTTAYGRNGSFWSDAEWIVCHDGKARRAKPGLRFLVDGLPGRVDLWRVGGNAIVTQAACEVLAALRETMQMGANQ